MPTFSINRADPSISVFIVIARRSVGIMSAREHHRCTSTKPPGFIRRDATGCLGDVQMGRLRREIPSLRGVLPTPLRRRFPQTTPRGLLREICNCSHYICRRRNAILDRKDHGSHANSEGVEVRTHTHARMKSTLTVNDPLLPLLDADHVSAASLMGAG